MRAPSYKSTTLSAARKDAQLRLGESFRISRNLWILWKTQDSALWNLWITSLGALYRSFAVASVRGAHKALIRLLACLKSPFIGSYLPLIQFPNAAANMRRFGGQALGSLRIVLSPSFHKTGDRDDRFPQIGRLHSMDTPDTNREYQHRRGPDAESFPHLCMKLWMKQKSPCRCGRTAVRVYGKCRSNRSSCRFVPDASCGQSCG